MDGLIHVCCKATDGADNVGSDLQFTPQNGTGPYTLVIAPANHPPVNITAKSGAMNYTIRLTHGQVGNGTICCSVVVD